MARTPQTEAAVPGSANLFFTRDRYERALEAVTRRLHRHAAADYSWFPDLVEIGGFHYESAERFFEPWAASLKSLLGDAVQPLLREAWEAIPRAAADKFAALINGVLSERDRIRIEQAYTRLKFPIASVNPDVLMTGDPTGASEAGRQPESVHEHTCSKCARPSATSRRNANRRTIPSATCAPNRSRDRCRSWPSAGPHTRMFIPKS